MSRTLEELKKAAEQDLVYANETDQWKKAKSNATSTVYTRRVEGSPLIYIKIVAEIPATLENFSSLLDTDIIPRQPDWHKLFIEGRQLEKLADNCELVYMSYKSPMPLISARDCVYTKYRMDLPDGGFLLSYRTCPHPSAPEYPNFVRIAFESAHIITPNASGGCTYVCTQMADAKGLIPKWLSNSGQIDVLMGEVEGVHRACKIWADRRTT